MKEVLSLSREDTYGLGRRLAALLRPGDVVTFSGSMGAGKTVLITGIAAGLGYEEGVSSPTFALANEYPTTPRLIHIDAYRLETGKEFVTAGMEEYLHGDAICVIEWPEAGIEYLPQNRLDILIRGSGEEPRTIYLRPMGADFTARLEAWA